MLAELAETIVTKLQALAPEKWGTLKGNTDIPFKLALDPDTVVKADTRCVYIIPVINNILLQESPQRGQTIQNLKRQPTINMSLIIPFKTFQIEDVADWTEIKKVLEFREYLEDNIIGFDLKVGFTNKFTLIDVIPEPPLEVELNQRNFLATTEFVYDTSSCRRT